MRNSTDLAYERDNFILQFLDCECCGSSCDYTEQDIEDCNEAIREYEILLQSRIDVGDKKGIKQIRAEIQHVKAKKKKIKRMMKNRMETVLT